MPSEPLIREQLEKILSSPPLAGSDQLKRLLRVTVDRVLSGQAESLKEYALGVEAFGRPEDMILKSIRSYAFRPAAFEPS